jgi:PAS domain S-box-containing protein
MNRSRRSKDGSPSSPAPPAPDTPGARFLLRGAQGQITQKARGWIAELAALRAAVDSELDGDGNPRLGEVRERLERLEDALRQAPDEMLKHLRRSIAEFASASTVQLRRIGEHEVTEKLLLSINEQLRQGISDRERLGQEAKRAERGLREVQERFESAFNNAPIGMALIAMDGHWLQVNDALCRIVGNTWEELQATTLRDLTHPDDVDLDAECLEQLLAGGVPSCQAEKRFRHAWGHHVWVLVTTSIVRDEEHRPLHFVTQVQDISERKELARRLEHVVSHDFLTGLLNRRQFELELSKEVERALRYGVPGAAGNRVYAQYDRSVLVSAGAGYRGR